jgi:chromosome segregation ATPase
MARRHVDEEDARSASFEEGGSKWPRARETTEGGVVTARANAAAARAAVASAARARAAAESRATSLEREIASRESELGRARRRAEGAAAGLTELERRTALAPLDSASKAFDLQLVAPPPSLAPRAGPPPLLMAAVGAFAAVFLGALLVLSRPE